jgi:hypothetical protein
MGGAAPHLHQPSKVNESLQDDQIGAPRRVSHTAPLFFGLAARELSEIALNSRFYYGFPGEVPADLRFKRRLTD